jgi:diaminopimelate epimerase
VTSSIHLAKLHGLGNDFLIALDEAADGPLPIDGALARELCDRRRGIGADGLIHGARPDAAQASAGIDVVMHLYNADGSRAEISGNGIRCLAHAVARQRGIDRGVIVAATDAGRRELAFEPGADAATMQVAVGMGRPTPGPAVPAEVEGALTVRHATVDMGNPHIVVEVDDPEAIDLTVHGTWIEDRFPGGVNVEYIAVAARDHLRLRVWERGAGITEACGSGACAAVHVAHAWGAVDDRVVVSMPGGDAEVAVEADGSVTLRGPSVHIADLEVPRPALGASRSTRVSVEV